MSRYLRLGEFVDVYLANLRKLTSLFEGILKQSNSLCFVARPLNCVKHTVQASSKIISQLLAWAPQVMKNEMIKISCDIMREGKTDIPRCHAVISFPLPVIKMHINEKLCKALVDSGCSYSLVNNSECKCAGAQRTGPYASINWYRRSKDRWHETNCG